MTYKLSEHDLHLALAAARERVYTKNAGYENFFGGFHSKDSHPQAAKRYYPHFLGILGEIAYARTFGEPLDLTFSKRGDRGYDFKDKVEVKTRKSKDKNPWLMVRKNDFIRKPCLKYVLCRLEPPESDMDFKTVDIAGFITYEDFKKKGQDLEMPGRTNWVIRASELTPFPDDS